jgi:Family of unknown function (DUF5946)
VLPTSTCPGCGIELPVVDGPTHPYLGSTAACWALYGEVLAREFNDASRFAIHQLTVDTYAAQHPGSESRRSTQSVGLHLSTLCMFVERGADPTRGPVLHRRLVRTPVWRWLKPPLPIGKLTVANVHRAATADEHIAKVWEWARDVWDGWATHHSTVRGWVDELLADSR